MASPGDLTDRSKPPPRDGLAKHQRWAWMWDEPQPRPQPPGRNISNTDGLTLDDLCPRCMYGVKGECGCYQQSRTGHWEVVGTGVTL